MAPDSAVFGSHADGSPNGQFDWPLAARLAIGKPTRFCLCNIDLFSVAPWPKFTPAQSHPFFGIPKRWIGSGTFSSGCKFVTGKYGPFFFDPEGASTVILLYQSQFLSSNDRQKAMEDQMDGSPSCTGH